MKLLPADDPALTQVAEALNIDELRSAFTRARITLMTELLDSMPGAVALAAPQVGWQKRVIVYDVLGHRGILINPSISRRSAKKRLVTEGCLTFPGQFWRVRRSTFVETASVNLAGEVVVHEWHALGAQMVQHEIDHLDGVLLPTIAAARVR